MAGAKAGEIIQSWCLPISRKMNIKHVAGLILPYPTMGEINKTAAKGKTVDKKRRRQGTSIGATRTLLVVPIFMT